MCYLLKIFVLSCLLKKLLLSRLIHLLHLSLLCMFRIKSLKARHWFLMKGILILFLPPSSQLLLLNFPLASMEVLMAIRMVLIVITLVVIFITEALSFVVAVEAAILSHLVNDIILLNTILLHQALILVFLVLELILLLAKSVVREVMLLPIVINVTTRPQPQPLLFNVKFAGNMGILPFNVIMEATSLSRPPSFHQS